MIQISLVKYLVLPLILTAGLSIWLSSYWSLDGFFINLTSELIGILFTVGYVDWVLRKHEEQKWITANQRVNERLRVLINSTVTGLRTSMGFGTDVLNMKILESPTPISMHKECVRIAEHVIAPAASAKLAKLDQKGWMLFAKQIQNSHNSVIEFLNLFQMRLSPKQLSDLLDFESSLANSLTSYSTFPDLLGVPSDKLPETRTPPVLLQQYGIESTAKEIENICIMLKELSSSTKFEYA